MSDAPDPTAHPRADFDSELLEAAARALAEAQHRPDYSIEHAAAAVLAVVVPLIEGRYEQVGWWSDAGAFYEMAGGPSLYREQFAPVFVHRSEETP